MNYLSRVSGIIHSVDPIFNEMGYARACFGKNIHSVRVKAEGRKLHFQVVGLMKVSDESSLSELTQGLITGDDTNVSWTVELTHAKVRNTVLAVA